jgi:hypothetical protein
MKLFVFISLLVAVQYAQAHPVSFEDSVGIMGYHAPKVSHMQVNYSWRHWFATGVHHFSLKTQDEMKSMNLISTNFLVKRWNGSSYQANIYTNLAVGMSDLSQESRPLGMGSVQFDIEDRKYYFLAKYSRLASEASEELTQITLRAGVAPYVANFNDIHSWIIIEWQSNLFLGQDLDVDITPYLRVFYKNVLFEIGHSLDGHMRFNFISHF